MSDLHSINPNGPRKPPKPYSAFPLYPHATKRWAKKIRGKVHYFGHWDDPDAALQKYEEQKDALHAGRSPRPDPGARTVKELCNAFLAQKQALVDTGELTAFTWRDYKVAADEVVEHFGNQRLVPGIVGSEFAALRNRMAKKWGPHRLGKTIQCIRSIFKYGYDEELLDRPVRFGPGFKRPSKKTLRIQRAKQGAKLFTAEEIHGLLGSAGPALKAMLLLGINAGLGNADCGHLPISALDLKRGWLDYPRPKTGVGRPCPLWPETGEAGQVGVPSQGDRSSGLLKRHWNYQFCGSGINTLDPFRIFRYIQKDQPTRLVARCR